MKFPKKAFWYLTHLLGKTYDDPQIQQYMKRFPYYTIEKDEERGTPLFKSDTGSVFIYTTPPPCPSALANILSAPQMWHL